MRTTLTLDDDILAAAKAIADAQHKNVGEVISDLVRQALRSDPSHAHSRNGAPLLPVRGAHLVTPELVNRLRDELPG